MLSRGKIERLFLEKRRRATQVHDQEPTPYASGADFCQTFLKDTDGLYLLSLLLTGNHSLAEHCFLNSLKESQRDHAIFKEWTNSWARRNVIQNAIRMIRPRPTDSSTSSRTSDLSTSHAMAHRTQIAGIIMLPPFERFVFVISVLERHSLQECALLLSCTRAEVIAARTRALWQIANALGLPCKDGSIDSGDQGLPGSAGSPLLPETVCD